MKKIISFLLLCLILINLIGCENFLPDSGNGTEPGGDIANGEEDGNNETNNGENENDDSQKDDEPEVDPWDWWFESYPWYGDSRIVFDSYGDLMDARETINKNAGEEYGEEFGQFYVLPDYVGENYTVEYVLQVNLADWRFDHSKQMPTSQSTLLFLHGTSRSTCGHVSPEDPMYYFHGVLSEHEAGEEYDYLDEMLMVQIKSNKYVKIEDRSLLSVKKRTPNCIGNGAFIVDQPVWYTVYYGDTEIAGLNSCIELDDEVISVILNNLCGINDLQDK